MSVIGMAKGLHASLAATALVVAFGCGGDRPEPSALDGERYTLKVDRVADNPDVQFPSDSLEESDYEPTDRGPQYDVGFSENGETVTIASESIAEPGAVLTGSIETDTVDLRGYTIVEGLPAGGRFNVWVADGHFEAELTIYGSGVPIIRSERGRLAARSASELNALSVYVRFQERTRL